MIRPPTLLFSALLAGCSADRAPAAPGGAAEPATHAEHEWFVERAQDAGLDFVHVNGMSGEFYFPENMSPGVGMLDYDNDGDLDVYLVQGQMLGPVNTTSQTLRGRLFRNDLTVLPNGTRTLRFTDVTDQAGIDARDYGIGVATGDIDNDGCADLYLTNFGSNRMFHNLCNGTFADVSERSGTGDPGFSVSASFVDFDRDGWLDLYVANYLDYSIATNKPCSRLAGERDYCPPVAYRAQPDRLYRNQRNGTFADVTAKALSGGVVAPALGLSTADFNGDGWIDIYVTNDNRENLLWINQRDGTLRNTALLAGVALPASGKAEASMGVDAGDFDNDGDEDLFMTELTGEGHNLFVNDGSGFFEDQSLRSGLGPGSLPYTGFGTAWLDFDNDGRLDIMTVNGTISAIEALRRANDPLPYRQRKQLFRNLGDGRFDDVTDAAGAAFHVSEMGRGAAFGDLDNDGDVDVVVANDAGRTRLLVNQTGNGRHWLGLRLGGTRRDMVGARVSVSRKDGSAIWRRARADGSYASANDPRVLAGLGDSIEAPIVRVLWPSGRAEEWTAVPIDRYTTLTEGTGRGAANR